MIINKNKFYENRGSIYTVYDQRDLKDINFVQDKISESYRGTIRGFHGDSKTWKLITCLYGKIKLVTYDIETQHKQEYLLDSDNMTMTSILVKPKMLNAHQCLSSFCIFYYKWSEFYTKPEDQWTVRYDDPEINANWDTSLNLILSERDKTADYLKKLKIDLLKK